MFTSFLRLWPYIRQHSTQILAGTCCALVTNTIAVLIPWILKIAIDDLQRGISIEKLRLYPAVIVGVALVGSIFRFVMHRGLFSAARRIEYDIRNEVFRHLERWSLADFQQYPIGDLMSRTTNDLASVRMMVAPVMLHAISTLFLFTWSLSLMLSLSIRLTLFAIIPLSMVTISVRYFGRAIHKQFSLIQAQIARVTTIVHQTIVGVRIVRAYRLERPQLQVFREANDEFLVSSRRLVQLEGVFHPTLHFLLGLSNLLVLWLGSREVLAGRLTTGGFVAYAAYLMMLSWPVQAFGWVINMLQRGMASWQRMLELLDRHPAITDREAMSLPAEFVIRGDLTFSSLTFSYGSPLRHDGQRPLDDRRICSLTDISFHVERGATIAIVGRTGSGKSTLIQLIARIHDPPPGTVFVDGIDVRKLPLSVLRSAIGIVPQNPVIFSNTIAANIAYGAKYAPGLGERDIRWAARVACLEEDIALLPEGYNTLVGELGVNLSGGQRQRTVLARSLMMDPRILVLDDALSAVDTYTEEKILQRLKNARRGNTLLIVSHRVSTVRGADLILVLDNGNIIERGTHDHLVSLGGVYADLHRKQSLQEQLSAS